MAHRLFHTLVLSSSLLLDGAMVVGCDAASHQRTEVPPADGGHDAMVVVEADAGGPPMPDAGMPDAGPLLPLCEPGWPTTKGQICEVDTEGVGVCCRIVLTDDAGEPLPSDCCIAQPEESP